MPIYPSHKALFVHIPKNGGSTVTTLLKRDSFFGRRVNQTDPRDGGRETISELLEVMGDEAKDYFKFSFVRNPWDRAVSAYHYVCQRRPEMVSVNSHPTFAEFTRAFADDPEQFLKIRYFRPQFEYLTTQDGDRPLDYIGHFENYDSDLRDVLKKIGIRRTLIRHRKKTKRSDYRDYYDDRAREAIAGIYARDIEELGYEFEGGSKRKKSFLLRFMG
ncbi:sulfotransferase family 2 domain-containing protein [Primorskyibacter sp. S87]|uniref:sulfotransferase family 2 domain-containing protein n=1 Tax=Primorskyibacter sp. S87 TaxID=3415126 RepID=UPI003C7D9B7A